MNQIISYIKVKNKKMRRLFYIQLIISIIVILILLVYFIKNTGKDTYETTADIKTNFKLTRVYNTNISNKYLGNLIIEKINLEYPIFSEYSEENLKISVCKFSGNSLNENGNITILGHNYKDKFFGELEKLETNDKIIIEANRRKI